ncbi:MAG TPA: outer membrane beta-barrel protein [Acidobacteriaceae bacterium]|nr:outer membrane beta-barrel protein [Acidobacteriaceae bacterium]
MPRRGIAWSFAAVLLLAGVCSARAQSPESAVGDWSSLAVGGSFNASRIQYGQRWLLGGTAFVDANFTWRFGIEGETNWEVLRQFEKIHATTYLVGPRYQFSAIGQNAQWRPYVKFLAGDGYFNFPYHYAWGNYFVMAPGGGVDYRVNSRIRLRVVDMEYQYWPGFTYGSMTTFNVSTGVRYRIR